MTGEARFACDSCDFALPFGWGGTTYVVDDDGNEIACPEPGPAMYRKIKQVTGLSWSEAWMAHRVKFRDHRVCGRCGRAFAPPADDRRHCPNCGSDATRPVSELIDRPCPRCGSGIFRDRADPGLGGSLGPWTDPPPKM